MPITKSAKLALIKDKKRELINKPVKTSYKTAYKNALQNTTKKNLKLAYSALDRAAKKRVIHKNKASRLKSKLAKKISKKTK